MPALSYRSAVKIAYREMHSSRGKFFFVILSVAIGVAALTGVRGFTHPHFEPRYSIAARSIMAADLSARMFQQPTPEQQKSLDQIAAEGIEITPITELLSMASSPKTLDPLLGFVEGGRSYEVSLLWDCGPRSCRTVRLYA